MFVVDKRLTTFKVFYTSLAWVCLGKKDMKGTIENKFFYNRQMAVTLIRFLSNRLVPEACYAHYQSIFNQSHA